MRLRHSRYGYSVSLFHRLQFLSLCVAKVIARGQDVDIALSYSSAVFANLVFIIYGQVNGIHSYRQLCLTLTSC